MTPDRAEDQTRPLPVVARVRQRAARDLRRTFTNPFEARRTRPLLVHCGHHKAGTVWFRRILLTICRQYGLRYRNGEAKTVQPDADLVFHASARTFGRLQMNGRAFRGSHLIRDPRDLVVSGYEYHLVTGEQWALDPDPLLGGQSYQARLRDLDRRDGLLLEIERLASGVARELQAWDYSQPEFIELRYEDVLDDEPGSFEKLFRWYGLTDHAVEFGLEAVDRFSLSRGGARPSHVRSGVPGEWQEHLGPEHIERFKELTGDLVVRLGYESTADW